MGRTWGTGLVVTAGLIGAGGCNSTARPMVFHRNNPEPCPPVGMPMSEGPMLGEMPVMTPGSVMQPGGLPPGTVTIPGPGVGTPPPPPAQVVPPATAPPVGPQPRVAPTNPTQLPGKPTT